MKDIENTQHTTGTGQRWGDRGFTLVEILIAIVLVGILSAVVVVGISSLTSEGSKSACTASLDASKAGSVVYYASHVNTYPPSFTQLTSGTSSLPAALTLSSGVVIDPANNHRLTQGSAWTLTMTDGASPTVAPTFACS